MLFECFETLLHDIVNIHIGYLVIRECYWALLMDTIIVLSQWLVLSDIMFYSYTH